VNVYVTEWLLGYLTQLYKTERIKDLYDVRFGVFTVVSMMLFWVLVPCRLAGRCQRLGESYCLHLQS
jgi:hypothetical protein